MRFVLAAAVALAGLGCAANSASAATIHVHNTHNAGPGSLRHAVSSADAGDVIVVPGGTYRLTSGELRVDVPLTIRGAGASRTTVNAGFDSRVLELTSAADPVKISRLAITRGREQYGGGILNAGNLTLRRVVVHDNHAADESFSAGGGIANIGSLMLVRSVVRDNRTSAVSEGLGGGISAGQPGSVSGQIKILRSVLVRNSAPVDGFGGAIFWQTTNHDGDTGLKIVKSTLAGNSAIGGGLFRAPGGAIFFNPYVSAAVAVSLDIRKTTLADNRAYTSDSESWGGAIGVQARAFAAGSSIPVNIVNSTLTENKAGGHGGDGFGGGIWIDALADTGGSVPLAFTNATIARNAALGDAGEGGGIYFSSIGSAAPGPPTLLNTIVAQNSASTGSDCNTALDSAGHNLERHASCGFTAAGDQQETNPLLEALADNGGPTRTMALRPGSPAKNHGSNLGCPATDQRGVRRPQGNRCDVGAYEARVRP
jgi:hypothetical protein